MASKEVFRAAPSKLADFRRLTKCIQSAGAMCLHVLFLFLSARAYDGSRQLEPASQLVDQPNGRSREQSHWQPADMLR